jgi:hypothetical protein
LELEFRVFREKKLVFRKSFDVAPFDIEANDKVALILIDLFQREHPDTRLDDPSVTSVWCAPSDPLDHNLGISIDAE